MRRRLIPSAVLLAALAGTAAWTTACSPADEERADTSPPVDAALVRAVAGDLPAEFEAGGVLRARATSVISSRVLAPIAEIRVRPGDRVERGQVLVVLDGREFQAHAERAAAARVAAGQAVLASQAEKEAAEAALGLATVNHDRISTLHAKRSATAQELDEGVATLRAASSRAAATRARAAEAAAALTVAESTATAAAITASYSALSSPFEGMVIARAADPGSMAAPGVPILTIEDTSAWHLEVLLDESRAGQLAAGHAARARLDEWPQAQWIEGRVIEISRIDPASHGFLVKVEVPASAASRTGAFGRVRFAGPPRRALTVPGSALLRRGQLTFVFAVDADRHARLRPVSTGQTLGDRIEILAGLTEGDEIVAAPPASLTDGTSIRSTHDLGTGAAGGERR